MRFVYHFQCSVLVDRMIHRSLSKEGGEALSLLLKRSWNPIIGLQPPEKQVGLCLQLTNIVLYWLFMNTVMFNWKWCSYVR